MSAYIIRRLLQSILVMIAVGITFTAIGDDCDLTGCEIEDSIVLANSTIRNVDRRIADQEERLDVVRQREAHRAAQPRHADARADGGAGRSDRLAVRELEHRHRLHQQLALVDLVLQFLQLVGFLAVTAARLRATLGEISFVDLGADGRTSASIAARQNKEPSVMADDPTTSNPTPSPIIATEQTPEQFYYLSRAVFVKYSHRPSADHASS